MSCCETAGCITRPTFNVEGSRVARFCATHKLDGMVNVKSKRCETAGCGKQPAFNIEGTLVARFCTTHKLPGMVDVKHTRCEQAGCGKIPTYNTEGCRVARFCTTHKLPGMVDVKNTRCEQAGCSKRPSYNTEGSPVARFCTTHKLDGMVDVKHMRCEQAGCDKRPAYGSLLKLTSHCATHKTKGMVLRPRTQCSSAGCAALGTHEARGTGARFCEDHASADALNLGIFPCAKCGISNILDSGLCIDTCAPVTIKYRAAKELRIRSLFAQAGHGDAAEVGVGQEEADTYHRSIFAQAEVGNAVDAAEMGNAGNAGDTREATEPASAAAAPVPDPTEFVHNKTLEGKPCGRERPDFLFDCGTHLVIVEVDENQHSHIPRECEQARMVNLAGVRGMPVTFIRYNPDKYDPAAGQTVASEPQRHTHLLKWLAWARATPPPERGDVVSVLYLYYDGHDTQAPALQSLVRIAAEV